MRTTPAERPSWGHSSRYGSQPAGQSIVRSGQQSRDQSNRSNLLVPSDTPEAQTEAWLQRECTVNYLKNAKCAHRGGGGSVKVHSKSRFRKLSRSNTPACRFCAQLPRSERTIILWKVYACTAGLSTLVTCKNAETVNSFG